MQGRETRAERRIQEGTGKSDKANMPGAQTLKRSVKHSAWEGEHGCSWLGSGDWRGARSEEASMPLALVP